MRKLIIGTRGSDLALFQANLMRDFLARERQVEATLKIIRTSGDKIDDLPFEKMEGKGFFTKELEDALLSEEIDLAAHSLKDLMTTQPSGLMIAAVGRRVDRRELLLMRRGFRGGSSDFPLKSGSVIGSGATRRQSQIRHLNPALVIKPIRGNVPTRIDKVRKGEFDATILAAAGVSRLGIDLSEFETAFLDTEIFLPAPGQGILAVQTRADDREIVSLFENFGTETERTEAALERGLLGKFDGGCSLPLGVFSEVKGDLLRLVATLGERSENSSGELRRIEVSGTRVDDVIEQAYTALTTPQPETA